MCLGGVSAALAGRPLMATGVAPLVCLTTRPPWERHRRRQSSCPTPSCGDGPLSSRGLLPSPRAAGRVHRRGFEVQFKGDPRPKHAGSHDYLAQSKAARRKGVAPKSEVWRPQRGEVPSTEGGRQRSHPIGRPQGATYPKAAASPSVAQRSVGRVSRFRGGLGRGGAGPAEHGQHRPLSQGEVWLPGVHLGLMAMRLA